MNGALPPRLWRRCATAGQPGAGAALQHAAGAVHDGVSHHFRGHDAGGKPVTWNAQDRGDRGMTFRDALARHNWQMLLGLVWGAAILMLAPRFIWWMMPVLAGLLLSAFLTVLSSRVERRPGAAPARPAADPGGDHTTPGARRHAPRAAAAPARQYAHAGADFALVVRGDTLQTPALAPLRMEH